MPQAIRSRRVLTPDGLRPATVVVEGEKIASVRAWNDAPPHAALNDYGDLVVMPGLVDTHVHINEPGRTEWEGFETATKAAVAGGVTTLVDMPLNCMPETINATALEAKRRAANGKTWVDWAAWGGVVHGNADSLPGLIDAGVPGFKCFMIHSGIDGFAWVDENDLRQALEKLRGTGLPLLVHAETAEAVNAAVASLDAERADPCAYSTWLASRPDSAELDAIALLIRLAEEFSAPIHIVHLATAQALPMLAAARARGVPITVETCAHYLCFAAEDIPDGATEYKCAPPIRNSANRESLLQALEDGDIDMITTDHSPCPPEMKRREEGRFDQAWGGIASLGLALPAVWRVMHGRGVKLESMARWMASAPAKLAGLADRKGTIAAGADADLVVFDPDPEWTIAKDDLHFRHKQSPYIGQTARGRVRETWLRGEIVFSSGKFFGAPRGREQVRA
ncbi:MAG TPA: allantoinase AllB [Terracidiphilus sp.]|nr:allantoinase AllB [Terracidiphilus sp.]